MLENAKLRFFFVSLQIQLSIEGDFDPVWGIPAAKWTVTTSEILGVIDSMAHFDLYTNDDGIISLRYAKTVHTVFDYSIVTDDDSKNGRKGEQDSVRESQIITGMLKFDFFSDMRDWDDDDFKLSGWSEGVFRLDVHFCWLQRRFRNGHPADG